MGKKFDELFAQKWRAGLRAKNTCLKIGLLFHALINLPKNKNTIFGAIRFEKNMIFFNFAARHFVITSDLLLKNWLVISRFINWDMPGLFFVYFCLCKQSLQCLQKINRKMSIQYMVLRFEPMTFRIKVSSHNQ